MPGAFLWDDKLANAASLTAIAGTVVSTMPLSNLLDPQPRLRARLLGAAASILVDLGADTAIEAAALISTSLPDTATIRWRLGPEESLVEAVPLFDMRLTDAAGPTYPAGWTFNRASAGQCFDGTGALVQVAADTPRFDHDPVTLTRRGLLLEEQRTNSIPNPRCEGATAPSTWPTSWGVNVGSGLALTIIGTGDENGLPYIECRLAGTATAAANVSINLVFPIATIAAAAGQVWTASLYARMVGGSGANINNTTLYITEYDGAGTTLVNSASAALAYTSAPLGQYRLSHTATLTHASTAYVRPRLQFSVSSGAVVDLTLRLALPQMEQGTPASSPILPSVGAPGASTRAADRARVLGLSFGGTFSLLVQAAISGGGTQTLIPGGVGPYNDSGNSSYIAINGTGPAYCMAYASGVNHAPTPTIAGTPGQADILVLAASGAGVSWGRNGSLLTRVVAWTVPSTLSLVSLGAVPWGDASTGNQAVGVGWYQRFALHMPRLSDAQVTALSSAGSSLVAAALTHDSGVLAAGIGDGANGNVVLLRASPATGRYLLVDVSAPGASFIDLGRLIAGPLWRISRSHAYGISEGRIMLDRRDRNPLTGAEFPVPAVGNPRVAKFTLPLMSSAEVVGQHRAMVSAVGAAGDALWIPGTTLSQSELNQRSLFGGVNAPGGDAAPTRDSSITSSRAFRLVERL